MPTPPEVAGLPRSPGVYALRDARGRLLYVGKANDLRRRVRSYFSARGGHSAPTRALKDEACTVEHAEAGSELEALLAEARTIREGIPVFNRAGVWPTRPAFVKLTPDPLPRVQVVRFPAADGGRYYGPFRPAKELRAALGALQPILRWRPCRIPAPGRCLYRELDRCLAPCSGAPPGDPGAYAEMLATLDRVLTGRGDDLLAALDARMRAEAAALRFERAAALRDRLAAVSRLASRAAAASQDGVLRLGGPRGARLLAVRNGRVVAAVDAGQEDDAVRAARLRSFIGDAWSGPGPGPATTAVEIRELEIVARYLARKRDHFVPVRPGALAGACDEIGRLLGIAPRARFAGSRDRQAALPGIPLLAPKPFVAIDFETADQGPDSACAVALVRVEDGRIVRTETRLIRPPRRRFLFSDLHGITWRDVAAMPSFGPVWEELAPLLAGAVYLAAHNASFDRAVLRACCAAAGLEAPALPFVCTVRLARRTWGCRPARLPDVCARLGIPLRHHDPTSDAEACASIVLAAAREGAEAPLRVR